MRNNKRHVVLSIAALLCLCLCLSGCGKTNVATKEPDKIETSTDQKADNTKDTDSGNSTAKDTDQEAGYQGDGSGVETVDAKTDEQKPSDSTPTSKPTDEPKATSVPTSNPKPTTAPAATAKPTAAPAATAKPTAAPAATAKPTAAPAATSKPTTASTATSKPTTAPTATVEPTTAPEEKAEVEYEQGVEKVSDITEPVKPAEEEKPVTPSAPKLSSAAQEYADYCAMSSEEQYAYYKSFASADDFMNWYNAAKAAYDNENQAIVLEPGAYIDLGEN